MSKIFLPDLLMHEHAFDELLPVVQSSLLFLLRVLLQLLLLVFVPRVHQSLGELFTDDKPVKNWMAAAATELPSDHGRSAVDIKFLCHSI